MTVTAKPVNTFTTAIGLIARLLPLPFAFVAFSWFVFTLHARDAYYTVLALLLPKRRVGRVIKKGDPGFDGMWPQYCAPREGDSRSPCPGLNVLANHGILPRNGKNISYKEMSLAIQKAFNLSPTLGDQLTSSAFLVDQGRGRIDLYDLNALGIVQHDASLTRHDIAFVADQGAPDSFLVNRFVEHATHSKNNRRRFSLGDMAYYNGLRRAECRDSNGQYSMVYSFFHKFFGSGNCALLYSIFDGDAEDLKVFLEEERFPHGWEPKVRSAHGHPILFAQITTLMVEFNTHEGQKLRPGDQFFNQRLLKLKSK
ncbi:hypothetical protein M407DRAFT_231607 [Tulasnella calospora MUT 4182]|uniref:Heme haloperoxidase family profile domain-containing protein n=1 Tax=Tulasnella calospora MUT 4182 TaxID=1051891 RepID=A0A0C3MIL9_9AGAM|nr:hypothetical protein M407DRAFT_231607 [Tulasnella calospora MUT 4182]